MLSGDRIDMSAMETVLTHRNSAAFFIKTLSNACGQSEKGTVTSFVPVFVFALFIGTPNFFWTFSNQENFAL